MEYQILIEKQPNKGFVATALGWPDCVAAGETRDQAIIKVQSAVADRVAHGEILQARVETPSLAEANDPWEAMAGRFADDPDWDAFEAELRRIREEANRA